MFGNTLTMPQFQSRFVKQCKKSQDSIIADVSCHDYEGSPCIYFVSKGSAPQVIVPVNKLYEHFQEQKMTSWRDALSQTISDIYDVIHTQMTEDPYYIPATKPRSALHRDQFFLEHPLLSGVCLTFQVRQFQRTKMVTHTTPHIDLLSTLVAQEQEEHAIQIAESFAISNAPAAATFRALHSTNGDVAWVLFSNQMLASLFPCHDVVLLPFTANEILFLEANDKKNPFPLNMLYYLCCDLMDDLYRHTKEEDRLYNTPCYWNAQEKCLQTDQTYRDSRWNRLQKRIAEKKRRRSS